MTLSIPYRFSSFETSINDRLNVDLEEIANAINARSVNIQPVTTVSTDYTILTTDVQKVISVDASGASRTLTLPSAASAGNGFSVFVYKSDTSSNTVILDGNASETINGATTYKIRGPRNGGFLICNGSNWILFNFVNSYYGPTTDGSFFSGDNQSDYDIGSGTAPGSIISEHNRFFRSVKASGSGTVRVIGISSENIWVIGGENSGSASIVGKDARDNTPDSSSVFCDGIAQAWVTINGSGGNPSIAGGNVNSNNISSITDNGVGDWTINFRRNMADADYAVTLGNGKNSGGALAIPYVESRTVSGVQIKINNLAGTAVDADYISVVVHGRLGVTSVS